MTKRLVKFSWSAPPLTDEDKKLIDAYESAGKPLDRLPYTSEFDQLAKDVGAAQSKKEKHKVFLRLLHLRKASLLPHANTIVDSLPESIPLSAEDEELVAAYERIGTPLDALPYSDDFENFIKELGKQNTEAIKHAVFQRLLRLRKQGRLPRVR